MADRQQYEALYQSIARDLYRAKEELLKEIGNSAEKLEFLEKNAKKEENTEIVQEIRYLQKQNQTVYIGLEELVNHKLGEIQTLVSELEELKYSYQQLQAAYESLADKVDVHNDKVLNAVNGAVDYNRIIVGTTEQVVQSMPYPEKVDYNRIAEAVAKSVADTINVDAIAAAVAEKLATKTIHAESVDYERIAAIVDEKLVCEEETEEDSYELVMDDEGICAIAKAVADELRCTCGPCECMATEETAEELQAEETAEENEVVEEVAITAAAVVAEGALVNVEDGLVQRLKKSFTAKMCQSEDFVKEYYSQLKNELTSYKKINSNVSWQGDRFNLGRDTIAKITIVGKTLNLYLDLNPADPELKTTVYHQKDVGNQKAYESTPFMVKIKSDAALKKALRLVAYLADAKQAEKEIGFAPVNYATEFAYASDEQLIKDGFIKVTQEKKVALDF